MLAVTATTVIQGILTSCIVAERIARNRQGLLPHHCYSLNNGKSSDAKSTSPDFRPMFFFAASRQRLLIIAPLTHPPNNHTPFQNHPISITHQLLSIRTVDHVSFVSLSTIARARINCYLHAPRKCS